MKQEMVQIQQTAVHNHTAAMIEFGTNLLSQTRKLTSVEAKVKGDTFLIHVTKGAKTVQNDSCIT